MIVAQYLNHFEISLLGIMELGIKLNTTHFQNYFFFLFTLYTNQSQANLNLTFREDTQYQSKL